VNAQAVVTVNAAAPVNRFRPDAALGAGVDGHDQGATRQIYTARNLRAMGSAGLRPLTYRLRTELGVEAWHWNAVGVWSDPAQRRGYWSSSSRVGPYRRATYGYRLPRRGNTVDQANDDGYSRIDDGSLRSFWKSNPYLDPKYTHESDARHPQWVLLDLRRPQPVDALRIHWGAPFARSVRVEYFVGRSPVYYSLDPTGHWVSFPHASFDGRAGAQTLRLASRPLRVRFVRVVMTRSSHTGPRGSADVRDRLGFAVRELEAGYMRRGFHDLVRHGTRARRQSVVYVSSTDPWHRASDIDRGYEQPSFQTVARSGLTNGLPMLTPVPILYGTPADAANEVRYLHALRIPVRQVEMGEEPDGQLAMPEDYGALYARFAAAIRRVDRRVALGGPGYQTSIPDWQMWPDASGDISWTHRFLQELRAHGALGELGFFSFEWYPFDNGCAPAAADLARAPGMLTDVLRRQDAAGLPPGLPKLITEYGWSAFATEHMVGLPGALLNADIVGRFLADGGDATYLYGYEPEALMRELRGCDSWGNLTLFRADDFHRIQQPVATYWAARMITRDWVQPGGGIHLLYGADSTARDAGGQQLVTAYAVRRPDGRLSVMLVNKDPSRTWDLTVRVAAGGAEPSALPGQADVVALTPDRYRWRPNGAHGYARPDRPPSRAVVGAGQPITLPPYSLAIVRTPPL
jgi:hypothetical protein